MEERVRSQACILTKKMPMAMLSWIFSFLRRSEVRVAQQVCGTWEKASQSSVAVKLRLGKGIKTQANFLCKWTFSWKPLGIAIYNNEVFISDPDNSQIHVFSTHGKELRLIRDPVLDTPRTLSVDKEGLLYVADTGIQSLTRQGQPLRKWSSAYTVGLFLSDGQIFATHWYIIRKLSATSLDGTMVRHWGTTGSEDGQIATPLGVSVFEDEVFVVDQGSHSVQVFTKEGVFLRKWGREGEGKGEFRSPAAIAVSDKVAYVGDTQGRIQAFDLCGRYLFGFEKFESISSATSMVIHDELLFVVDDTKQRLCILELE